MTDQQKNILCIDDDIDIRAFLKTKLEQKNYSVYCVNDYTQALEVSYEIKPDLLILDIMLENEDGYSICTKIKKIINKPIIIFSSLSRDYFIEKGLKAGADYFVSKTDNPEKLFLKIKELIGNE